MLSKDRFSNRVEDYIKYRPGYPSEILKYLEDEAGLTTKSIVADIGSGTGISAEIFLKNGNVVYGIEPNKEMREAGERLLAKYPSFTSINGNAEQTTLPSESINLIIAGQAFHWFDAAAAKKEFSRIAKPGAHAALIWNDRQVKSGFEIAYEHLLEQYALDYREINHRNIDSEKIKDFFFPQPVKVTSFYNEQVFDFEGVKGRMLSSSYMPGYDHPDYEKTVIALKEAFIEHHESGKVKFEYQTLVYLARIK